MLFYHTKYVIQKQMMKKQAEEEEDLGLDEEVDENDETEEWMEWHKYWPSCS